MFKVRYGCFGWKNINLTCTHVLQPLTETTNVGKKYNKFGAHITIGSEAVTHTHNLTSKHRKREKMTTTRIKKQMQIEFIC